MTRLREALISQSNSYAAAPCRNCHERRTGSNDPLAAARYSARIFALV
jgi:hypothetical protein